MCIYLGQTNIDVENPGFPWKNDKRMVYAVCSTSMLVYPRVSYTLCHIYNLHNRTIYYNIKL